MTDYIVTSDGTDDNLKIDAAIAGAIDGDTIKLQKGSAGAQKFVFAAAGSVTIDKALTIIGDDADPVEIVGGAMPFIIDAAGKDVVLENLKGEDNDYGFLWAFKAANVTVNNFFHTCDTVYGKTYTGNHYQVLTFGPSVNLDALGTLVGLDARITGDVKVNGFNADLETSADPEDPWAGDRARVHPGPTAALLSADGVFALVNGQTLLIEVDGGSEQTVTFVTGDFSDIGNATAAEVAAAINAGTADLFAWVVGDAVKMGSTGYGATSMKVNGGTANGVLGFSTTIVNVAAGAWNGKSFNSNGWNSWGVICNYLEEGKTFEVENFYCKDYTAFGYWAAENRGLVFSENLETDTAYGVHWDSMSCGSYGIQVNNAHQSYFGALGLSALSSYGDWDFRRCKSVLRGPMLSGGGWHPWKASVSAGRRPAKSVSITQYEVEFVEGISGNRGISVFGVDGAYIAHNKLIGEGNYGLVAGFPGDVPIAFETTKCTVVDNDVSEYTGSVCSYGTGVNAHDNYLDLGGDAGPILELGTPNDIRNRLSE